MSETPSANESLSVYEQLAFATIRLETDKETGTGFFYQVAVNQSGATVPLIITNKHVLQAATTCEFVFTTADAKGFPLVGQVYRIPAKNINRGWRPHPDSSIDLAYFPFTDFFDIARANGREIFTTFLTNNLIPTDDDIAAMIGMERVVMVGYPNGIWDETNNLPIFRQGVLASHYRYDWDGLPDFVVDIPTFPGSSGSPILLCDIGQVHNRHGAHFGQNRIRLLGINKEGFIHHADGSVTVEPISTCLAGIAKTGVPNNLGLAIKARELRPIESEVLALVAARGEKAWSKTSTDFEVIN